MTARELLRTVMPAPENHLAFAEENQDLLFRTTTLTTVGGQVEYNSGRRSPHKASACSAGIMRMEEGHCVPVPLGPHRSGTSPVGCVHVSGAHAAGSSSACGDSVPVHRSRRWRADLPISSGQGSRSGLSDSTHGSAPALGRDRVRHGRRCNWTHHFDVRCRSRPTPRAKSL